MKKYIKLIKEALEGIEKLYIFHFFVLLVSVFFMILSSFTSKILTIRFAAIFLTTRKPER